VSPTTHVRGKSYKKTPKLTLCGAASKQTARFRDDREDWKQVSDGKNANPSHHITYVAKESLTAASSVPYHRWTRRKKQNRQNKKQTISLRLCCGF
jgi:hypothetical protein